MLIVICPLSPGSWLQIQADSGGLAGRQGRNPEATMKPRQARPGPTHFGTQSYMKFVPQLQLI